ncbi:MAG TPA: hypothetical protein VKA85_07045, partial [Candidatus Limnocylindrales bacterium]|nr:hypothetical protein [Candidatus Limnocylindrales bacterium]
MPRAQDRRIAAAVPKGGGVRVGRPNLRWPAWVGVDYADAAHFLEKKIAGKTVLVGDPASIDQTEHARGRPYLEQRHDALRCR